MQNVIRQNFDELYAQVEERVKCVQPVKQADIHTKTSLWITINRILIDVLHDSQFVWVVDFDETMINIRFFDESHNSICTQVMTVPYVVQFQWPSIEDVMCMSATQLHTFQKQCFKHGIRVLDISEHYGHTKGWFTHLKNNRNKGMLPIAMFDGGVYLRKRVNDRLDNWDHSRILGFQFVYLLHQNNVPIASKLVSSTLGINVSKIDVDCFTKQIRTGSEAINKFITESILIDLNDLLIKYIDELIITLGDIEKCKRTSSTRQVSIVLRLKHDKTKIHTFMKQLQAIKRKVL